MATREVTLNLKKDKDGDYKIVADDNLKKYCLPMQSLWRRCLVGSELDKKTPYHVEG